MTIWAVQVCQKCLFDDDKEDSLWCKNCSSGEDGIPSQIYLQQLQVNQ